MQDFIIYNEDYQIFICRQHGYALTSPTVHLYEEHKELDKVERKRIATNHAHQTAVAWAAVLVPPPSSPPIDGLRPPIVGFTCADQQCRLTGSNLKRMETHARRDHGWRKTEQTPTHWTKVWVQTWFTAVGRRKYFQVRVVGVDVPASVGTAVRTPSRRPASTLAPSTVIVPNTLSTPEAQADLARLNANAMAMDRDYLKEQEKLERDMLKQDITGWWGRTHWQQHLQGRSLKWLAALGRLPDKDELVLCRAVEVFDVWAHEALEGIGTLDQEARRWLRSEKRDEISPRPFNRLQNRDSEHRYLSYMRRFLCYTLRVYIAGQDLDDSTLAGRTTASSGESTSGESGTSDDDNEDNHIGHEYHRISTIPVVDQLEKSRDACELFPWAINQQVDQQQVTKELYTALEEERPTDTLKAPLRILFRSFIFHAIGGDRFRSALIHFTAVLGIDEEHRRLREAIRFSYVLAGLVWSIRLLGADLLLPSGERDYQQEHPEVREQFLQSRRDFLCDGTGTPMSELINLLAYGKHVALNTSNNATVTWSRDKQTMFYKGVAIPLVMFRTMIHENIQRTETLLWERLMWVRSPEERFVVDLDRIEDNQTLSMRGYSFTSQAANAHLDNGREWMFRRMLGQRGKYRLRGSDETWKLGNIRRWLSSASQFLKRLLFAVHSTYGSLARGTELTAIRFRNGALQDRNHFLIDGTSTIIIRYHKSQQLFDAPKIIPRFLPYAVGQLLVVYLIYVQPFREYLLVQTQNQTQCDYIWHGPKGPWETDHLTRVIQRETGIGLGHRFHTLDFRHIVISIGRVVVNERFAAGYKEELGEIEEPDAGLQDPLEMQSGRGDAVGAGRYGVRADILKHLTPKLIDTFRPVSEGWHRFLDLPSTATDLRARSSVPRAPAATTPGTVGDLGKRSSRDSWEVSRPTPRWRALFATTESPNRDPASYGTGDDRLPTNSTAVTRAGTLVSSPGGHGRIDDVLYHGTGDENVDPIEPLGPRNDDVDSEHVLYHGSGDADVAMLPSESPAFSPTPAAEEPFPPDEIEGALHRLFGPGRVSFRSRAQEEGVMAVLRLETPVTVVLPTGGGKTLLALLPTLLEPTGVSIFVAPFRALVDDLVTRFTDVDVDCYEWTVQAPQRVARVIVVSADVVVDDRFSTFAHLLVQEGLLRRVFVDECHTTFTDSHWRKKLSQVSRVRSLGCPIYLLTATLPPTRVHELENSMAVRNTRIIRGSTVRPRHRYLVQACPPNRLEAQAVEICRRRLHHLVSRGERGVVYSLSKDVCVSLATALGCHHYHAGDQDRAERLESWVRHGGLIVATSALGTGVDIANIVFVLHVDLPYSMIDFAQQSGRAGRGGEFVDSIILAPLGKAEGRLRRAGLKDEEKAVAMFVASTTCRRRIMSAYLDGEALARSCLDEGTWARCDRCGEGVHEVMRRVQEEENARALVEKYLGRWTVGCLWCDMDIGMPNAADIPHSTSSCPGLEGLQRQVEAFRSRIRYAPETHSCFRCGISQYLCATKTDTTNACQWPGVTAVVLYLPLINEAFHLSVRQAGYTGEYSDHNVEAYRQWIGQRYEQRIWGENMSNGMAVLIRIVQRYSAQVFHRD